VLHQQLAATFEQFGERATALGRVENVILVDAHPRQRPPLAGDLVTQPRQVLFARQQRLALGNPFLPGDDAMVFAVRLGNAGRAGMCVFIALAASFGYPFTFSLGLTRAILSAGSGTLGVTSVTGF